MSDYISRQAAIEEIRKAENHAFNSFYKGLVKAHKIVADLSSADVTPVVHAYWRDTGSGQECSACKEIQYGYDTGRYFCANCGAKMDGEE